MDLDIEWTQGKCIGDVHFVTDKEICYSTGSFIKICATDAFSEISLQGPLENIECTCADSELKLISVAGKYIYVISYPHLEIVTAWIADRKSCVLQMNFAGDDYLLTLEGPPYFNLTLWNWKKAIKIENIQHKLPIEDAYACYISTYPSSTKLFVFQQFDGLYFYEIEDICPSMNLRKKAMYLPVTGDETGKSMLSEDDIENLTCFDKMEHDAWGIHSELLHAVPLKVYSSKLSERELIGFYDFFTKQERHRASCHCWLPNEKLLVACFSGTILSVALDFSVQIIHSPSKSEDKSHVGNYITCMAFNKNGLYMTERNGHIFFVQDIEKWNLTLLISVKECPVRMKFSPNFENALITNSSGSVVLIDVKEDLPEITYLSTCRDDSAIVGISIANSKYCVTTRASGLVETWEIGTGVPISQFHIHESIKTMEGCQSSTVILISGSSSYLFVVDISVITELRIVQISRPCESAIKIIKSENFGRIAFLVSEDQYIFIYSTMPSRNFEILGYILTQNGIEDLSVFSKGTGGAIFVSLLRKEESEDYIINMEIPEDFDVNFSKYWEDESGSIRTDFLKITEINLGTKCCSVVSHLLIGKILHLPSSNEFISIPYENIRTFKPKKEVTAEAIDSSKNCRMFLSPSHYMLITIDETGDVYVRKAHDFSIICKQRFSWRSRLSSYCTFAKDKIFLEGNEGVLICLKLPKVQDMEDMSWVAYCQKKRTEENKILSTMRSVSKTELLPWVTQRLNKFNQENTEKLKAKRNELEKKFGRIQSELQTLANINFFLPLEHQIVSEEFILDEEVKEELMKSRHEGIKNYETMLKEKIETIENDIRDIKVECVDNMQEKGKILMPIRKETTLYNYSIPIMSEKEAAEIRYSFKKIQIEKRLLKLKLEENAESEDFEKDLTFVRSEDDEAIEDIGKVLRKQPFQLQSREERMDYVFMLKYIILRKRLAFNRKFDEVENLRKDTAKKIKENNLRVKEIILLLNEEKTTWKTLSSDNDNMLEISDAEIEISDEEILEESFVKPKGLAEYFLKDEWFLKLKSTSAQKSQARLKKGNTDLLRKEIGKKLGIIDALRDHYENVHSKLVKEKLFCDLQINQEELQLCLILFSVANFPVYKKWEMHSKKITEELQAECKANKSRISELETEISISEKEIETLMNDSSLLDREIIHISKMSRNKQAFLEAYEKRPTIPAIAKSLNPYKEIKIFADNMIEEMNDSRNKPQKVSMTQWKQLCSFREQKIALQKKIDENLCETNSTRKYIQKLNSIQRSLKSSIMQRKERFKKLHETRIRCGFETPMVLPISDPQLEFKYPDDLGFKEALFFKRFHVEGLNGMITNAGNYKLEIAEKISKAEYQIKRNEARVRIDKLKLRDTRKEIELVKNIPLTKDIVKIIQDPKGFSLQVKIDALEKSKKTEMNEIEKQMNQVTERISNIELKKDILRRSAKEKKKEIEKMKGDIAELRKIEKLSIA